MGMFCGGQKRRATYKAIAGVSISLSLASISTCKPRKSTLNSSSQSSSPYRGCGSDAPWTQLAFERTEAMLKHLDQISQRPQCKELAAMRPKLELIKGLTADPQTISPQVSRF